MIKNIVFDIGNVLVDFDVKGFLYRKGFEPDIIKRIIKASLLSPYWEQFERGDLSEDEVMKAFINLDPEIEEQLYKAFDNVHGMLIIRDFAVDLVKKLKKDGFNVYYLSNYSSKAYADCSDSLAFMKYMDGGCVSFQERMTKPDINFYKRFLEKYNLVAEECIFVDDTPLNVEVAEKLGFKGILYESYENTVDSIYKITNEYNNGKSV